MGRGNAILTACIMSALLVTGCSVKSAPHPNSKVEANKLLKTLPPADSFEFINTGITSSDEHLRIHAVPSEHDWQRSDMAEVLGHIGAQLKDVLQAGSITEVSRRKLNSNAVIVQLSNAAIQRLKDGLDRTNFDISNVDAIEVFAAKTDPAIKLGRMSYAFIEDKLIIGDAQTVEQIVKALSGTYRGPHILDDEHVKSVWEQLPDGFSMSVAIGEEHSYVSGLHAVSHGESTKKLNKNYVEGTFIANFTDAQQAASAVEKIEGHIRYFANVTERNISVEQARASGNMVIVRTKTALSDVIF